MKSGYELFVSWRYLRSKRKDVFISLISVISISGVAVGVMALVIVLAVMTGMIDGLRDKILGTYSHIMVFQRGGWISNYPELIERLGHDEDVVGIAPFVYWPVMIQSDVLSTEATMKAIDVSAERTASDLAAHIQSGSLDFDEAAERAGFGMVIGSVLAEKLQVTVGDRVALVSMLPNADSQWPAPKREVFEITGIFEFGMYEYDGNLTYISLDVAQAFLERPGQVTGLEIKVANMFQSRAVAESMQRDLGIGFKLLDWSEANKNLFSLYGLYKKLMFLMLTIIVLVACLNIASTLIMMVMEKGHDIAILKSMGASAGSIQKLFVLQGAFIGIAGTVLGCLIGIFVCWVADTYHIIQLDGAVYLLNYLPFKVMPLDVALVAASSVLICFLSTLYPARQAARLDPAVALRCE